ncbi:MAG: hypothetical protein HN742_30080 [Lentisphaerae bacterium]|jgi:hypothetical protein|nr:hypothetical protein [Lentisphaerota bacterium]MBT5612690.1 hypothetical protein [Lentisphaerota bacterium]MBT7057564.1 hypothetical protein [Lentisphaerota bacterium]MBT7846159.1 hypothetical protein [Lentisphaerota bacterium]
MRSSWLLLRALRHRLFACLLTETVLVFLFCYAEMAPSGPERLQGTICLGALLAVALTAFVLSPFRPSRLPFPVSVRQRAWLPVLVFVLLWASGGASITVTLLLKGLNPFAASEQVHSPFVPLLLCFLAFLFCLRVWRSKPHFVGGIGLLFALPTTIQNSPVLSAWGQAYWVWGPAAFVAVVFYLWEAPIQLARVDRFPTAQSAVPWFPRFPDLTIASPPHPVVCVGDTLEIAFLLALASAFLSSVVFGRSFHTIPTVLRWGYPCGLGYGFVCFARTLFRNARAGGLSHVSALGLAGMQSTLILHPLGLFLGAKKGVLAVCTRCNAGKFLWMTHCRHCENRGPGRIVNKAVARTVQGKAVLGHRRAQILKRVVIPLQLFIFSGWLPNIVGDKPYATRTVFVSPDGTRDSGALERDVARVKEAIETHSSPVGWGIAETVSSGSIPERFRLEVRPFPSGTLCVRAYGLRWDSPENVPLPLANRLAEDLGDSYRVHVSTSESSFVSPWKVWGFLDNAVHWVEPRIPRGDVGRSTPRPPRVAEPPLPPPVPTRLPPPHQAVPARRK